MTLISMEDDTHKMVGAQWGVEGMHSRVLELSGYRVAKQ